MLQIIMVTQLVRCWDRRGDRIIHRIIPHQNLFVDILRSVDIRSCSHVAPAGRAILSNKFGGLSGPAVKPVGVRAIYDLRSSVDIPLIGVGGIQTWRDAAEYIMAGASAYQVGSAIGTHGTGVINAINEGLKRFMKEYGYSSLEKMVGAAHV